MTLDELYAASRAASNAYAGMDAPDLPEDPWMARDKSKLPQVRP